MTKSIRIWRFDDAPKEYRDMSRNGGDEDWVAVVPSNYVNEYLGFLAEGTSFGCCAVDEFMLDDGSKLLIGSHA